MGKVAYFTGTPVSFYNGSEDVCFQPRWLVKSCPQAINRGAKQYESLADFCRQRKPRVVCVHRTYALGDVLMLLPVLKLFHRAVGLSHPVMLATGTLMAMGIGNMKGDKTIRVVRSIGVRDYGADVHMDLNSCLEADHRGGEESNWHRMDLYGRALGIL